MSLQGDIFSIAEWCFVDSDGGIKPLNFDGSDDYIEVPDNYFCEGIYGLHIWARVLSYEEIHLMYLRLTSKYRRLWEIWYWCSSKYSLFIDKRR